MRKIFILTLVPLFFIFGQCMMPLKSFFGLQTGMNYSIFDPDDGAGNYSGIGFQAGIGMGMEFFNTIGIQMAPQFKATSFERTVLNIEIGADYKNLYLPFLFQLKAGMLPLLSPYVGMGIAGNFQLEGTAYVGSLKTSIEDLENDLYFLLSMGAEMKLIKLKITPEFVFNYNLTADDPDSQNRTESNYDFSFSLGLFYTP